MQRSNKSCHNSPLDDLHTLGYMLPAEDNLTQSNIKKLDKYFQGKENSCPKCTYAGKTILLKPRSNLCNRCHGTTFPTWDFIKPSNNRPHRYRHDQSSPTTRQHEIKPESHGPVAEYIRPRYSIQRYTSDVRPKADFWTTYSAGNRSTTQQTDPVEFDAFDGQFLYPIELEISDTEEHG